MPLLNLFRIIPLLWLGLLAAAPAVVHAPPETAEGFTFVLMADPQFGMTSDNRDFLQETENMAKAVAAANRLKPAFVVVLGDLINRPGDPAQIAEYRRLAGRLDPSIPLYNVAGNHDVGNIPTPDSLAAYRKTFGRDYYSFEANGVVGLVLDTSILKAAASLPEENARQKEWLAGELRKAKENGKRALLFQHIPWFLEDAGEPEKYENIGPEIRREYLGLLRSSAVSHVFAGHRHMNGGVRFGTIDMVVVGPVGKSLGPDPSGFLVVTVKADGLSWRYRTLDELFAP